MGDRGLGLLGERRGVDRLARLATDQEVAEQRAAWQAADVSGEDSVE